jgi:hypothetical protein
LVFSSGRGRGQRPQLQSERRDRVLGHNQQTGLARVRVEPARHCFARVSTWSLFATGKYSGRMGPGILASDDIEFIRRFSEPKFPRRFVRTGLVFPFQLPVSAFLLICENLCNLRIVQWIPRNSRAVPENRRAFSLAESLIDSMSLPGWASPRGKG